MRFVGLILLLFAACESSTRIAKRPRLCKPKKEDVRFSVDEWNTDFCKTSVDFSELRGGGPPRDGIPPIDAPKFTGFSVADSWLTEKSPLIAVVHGGNAKGYPLEILLWHEIVNDTVGGKPLAITFCPLCYAAIAYERPTVDNKLLTFGTSGNLRNSDMVMWDRQTESWWQQFSGDAIVGALTGTSLTHFDSKIMGYKQFKDLYPNGKVLSRETGHNKKYGSTPYAGYDNPDTKPFLFEGEVKGPHKSTEYVVGIKHRNHSDYVTLKELQENRVIQRMVGGIPLVYFWTAGANSTMDKTKIAESKDLGTVAVFVAPSVDLVWKAEGNYIADDQGNVWDLSGRPMSETGRGPLKSIPHRLVYWFAWQTFFGELPNK